MNKPRAILSAKILSFSKCEGPASSKRNMQTATVQREAKAIPNSNSLALDWWSFADLRSS